ncbi:hypothetical protein H5U98_01465 [Mycolicibacterium boenickei]|uniref:Transmembrane protein n=1 Tax=Mycolicibacterium boenickei TaxID=146017 RepID=A0AAX3A793_9MYCO|nr:hypothetical protein CQY21_04645 [Mycolicibacterium boenickei]UNC02726.1 hypothetical protein H5U98_01465 [Mycolicibacterium boenickei]
MPAYALALSLLITGPLLGPGYLLLRDAVSTPRSYLTDAALGLTEAAPRALPQDFFVALASAVLDGGVVVKVLLVAALWLAGWGAARLASTVLGSASPGQFLAATLAIWNPYVAERLLQGHWSLLVGYGCLPWVAVCVLRLRTAPGAAATAGLLFWIALAGLTPTGLMLAATIALVSLAAPGTGWGRLRVGALALGTAVLAAMPWLVSAAVGGTVSAPESAAGVHAFAARAEPGLATLGSLAGLGGIWNGEAVPVSRTTLFAVVATAVLLGLVALGLPVAVRNRSAVPLLGLAAVAVLIPAAMATGPGLAFVDATIRAVPGLGVLRDGQKWVALAMPGYVVAAAAAPVTLARLRVPLAASAAVGCAALIAVLPDLAWGVGNQMRPVQYPAGWTAAAAHINADPRPVVALPPDSMRMFYWAGASPVLDPLPRWLRAEVLSTGDLVIGGQVVPGEGTRAREVQDLLRSGADRRTMADAGVGWLVVETNGVPAELDLPVAYRDGDIALYRIGGDHPASPHRGVLIAAHLVWLGVLAGGAIGMVVSLWRGRRQPESR